MQAAQAASVVAAETPTNGFLWPNQPNIIDFTWWLQTNVAIPAAALPASSPYPQYALWQALQLVLCIPGVAGISYTLAVYNCGTALLFAIAPDVPGSNFFTDKRAEFNLINPSTGLVSSASDESTSSTLTPPKWVSGLTPGQLDLMKTPWGRFYLDYQSKYGPTVWGLS